MASPSETIYATFDQAATAVFKGARYVTKNIQLSTANVQLIEDQLATELPTNQITVATFTKDNTLAGYGMVTNHIGKHEPITFFVGVTPDFKVKDIVVMVYREAYGSKVRKRRFLKQFRGKSMQDPLQVNHDITSLSGATLSSYAIANGARRVLATLQQML
ncbi:MAG: FMN-binding protein [Candidatus Marinamargulisbacteria bacterium]